MSKNLVTNGDFKNGLSDWDYSGTGSRPEAMTEGDISFVRLPAGEFMTQNLTGLEVGKKYLFSLKARSGKNTPQGIMATRGQNDNYSSELQGVGSAFSVSTITHHATKDVATQIFMLNEGIDMVDGVYLDITDIQFSEL